MGKFDHLNSAADSDRHARWQEQREARGAGDRLAANAKSRAAEFEAERNAPPKTAQAQAEENAAKTAAAKNVLTTALQRRTQESR